jgi:hypothetical protein
MFLLFPQVSRNWRYESEPPLKPSPRPTTLLQPRSNGKPEAVTAFKLLMMGVRMPETSWAVFKLEINLRDWWIWLVDLFKFYKQFGTNSIIVLMFVESQRVQIYREPVRYVTKTWSVVLLNKKIHILVSQVYCVWQVAKTPIIISNNPV